MVTSSTILDEHALLFSTALGSPPLESKRQKIEESLTTGPLCQIPRIQLSSALRSLALDSAQTLLSKFLPDLEARLSLPKTVEKPIPEQETPKSIHAGVTNEQDKKQDEEAAKQKQREEAFRRKQEEETLRKKQNEEAAAAAAAAKAKPEERAAKQTAKAALKISVGTKVEDVQIIKALDLVGKCSSGYPWIRTDGGFKCSGGGHKIADSELS